MKTTRLNYSYTQLSAKRPEYYLFYSCLFCYNCPRDPNTIYSKFNFPFAECSRRHSVYNIVKILDLYNSDFQMGRYEG